VQEKKVTEFQPIVSSNIEAAAWSPLGRIIVRFKNGSAYEYPNCDADLWKEFQKTFDGKQGRSAGKFLNARLRPRPYERIDDWK